jgi:hypothetical protein
MSMDDDLRARRWQTWQMLKVNGVRYTDVVSRVANDFDVSEGTVKSDISRMDDWLPKLVEGDVSSGLSHLMELRSVRQRMHELAQDTREAGEDDQLDPRDEIDILRRIADMIESDVELAQSLGMMDKAPEKHKHEHDESLRELERDRLEKVERMREETNLMPFFQGQAELSDADAADMADEANSGPDNISVDVPTDYPPGYGPDADDDDADDAGSDADDGAGWRYSGGP